MSEHIERRIQDARISIRCFIEEKRRLERAAGYRSRLGKLGPWILELALKEAERIIVDEEGE